MRIGRAFHHIARNDSRAMAMNSTSVSAIAGSSINTGENRCRRNAHDIDCIADVLFALFAAAIRSVNAPEKYFSLRP
jgi:hypothetical protein